MNARKLIVPGLVFFAGALFGRLFGVKPLVKGAMTVATMSGIFPDNRDRLAQRRVNHRSARRRAAARRSSRAA